MTFSVTLAVHFSRKGLSAFLYLMQLRCIIEMVVGGGISKYSVATIRNLGEGLPKRASRAHPT